MYFYLEYVSFSDILVIWLTFIMAPAFMGHSLQPAPGVTKKPIWWNRFFVMDPISEHTKCRGTLMKKYAVVPLPNWVGMHLACLLCSYRSVPSHSMSHSKSMMYSVPRPCHNSASFEWKYCAWYSKEQGIVTDHHRDFKMSWPKWRHTQNIICLNNVSWTN